MTRIGAALFFLWLATSAANAAETKRPIGPQGSEYWRAIVFAPQGVKDVDDFSVSFERLVKEALAPMGINVVIFDMHWTNFRFKCRPEFAKVKLSKERQFGKADARRLTRICRENGVRVMVGMNFLTHQNYGQLLKAFPELQWPRSKDIWDPFDPKTNEIAFAMADELLDAFQADGFHVGMDEGWGFHLDHFPKKKVDGWTPATLFAKCVKDYHEHFVGKRGVTMLMWDDMLYRQNRGTEPALDMIPKDIVLCHWDYSFRRDYPMLRKYVDKGFRVLGCPWKNPAATRAMTESVLRIDEPKVLGVLYTTWYGRIGTDLRPALLREKGWKKLSATVKGLAEGMRLTLPMLGPTVRTSIELLTPSIQGLPEAVYTESTNIRVRFQVFRRGRCPAPVRRAAAGLFLESSVGGKSRELTRNDTSTARPTECTITIPKGTYSLEVRGKAELEGAPGRITFQSPGPSFCVGREYWLDRRLQGAIHKTDLEDVFAEIAKPPRVGRVLATIAPGQWTGDAVRERGGHWLFGPWPLENPKAFVIVFPPHTSSAPGDFCEVSAHVRIPESNGRVQAQVFLADNFHMDKWTKYRFYQLLCDGRLLWQEDILADRKKQRWSSIDVTSAIEGGKEVLLTLRVIDKRGVTEYPSTTLIGPLRLVSVP